MSPCHSWLGSTSNLLLREEWRVKKVDQTCIILFWIETSIRKLQTKEMAGTNDLNQIHITIMLQGVKR